MDEKPRKVWEIYEDCGEMDDDWWAAFRAALKDHGIEDQEESESGIQVPWPGLGEDESMWAGWRGGENTVARVYYVPGSQDGQVVEEVGCNRGDPEELAELIAGWVSA